MNAFQIGFYQLENLVLARPNFRFFDVRLRPVSIPVPRVQALLDNASVVPVAELPTYLDAHKVPKTDPIVLVCEDSRASHGIALQLEKLGFDQLYIVEGGVDGLLRESSFSG